MTISNINKIPSQLILQAQNGDIEARNKLIELSIPQIKYCIRDRENENDLLQEIVILIIKYLNSFKVGQGNFKHWISVIAKNFTRKAFNKKVRRKDVPFTVIHSDFFEIVDYYYFYELKEPKEDQRKLVSEIMNIVEELSPAQKQTFQLYFFEGLTHVEIAQFCGVTATTSKSNLSRAKQRIIQQLNK